MAEVLGLVSSILAIAETGAKVATTLGKLSVQLKNAGKEAKEIARKIKLVSKVLKQIEVKLRDGRSSIDLSLVEDYILLCEERMEEATRLVEVLESEMNSPRTWDRAKFRIRFILEKSTFTLLQQDMDSLHLTLDLYVTTLIYQQVGKNEVALEEIQERLTELKQEVEDDLQVRSAGASVNAAILTIQYNTFLSSASSAPSRSRSSEAVVEEVDSENGDDQSEHLDHSSNQSLTRFMSRSDIGSFDGNQSVPLNVLEDDTVSKALVVFTQIQVVQKKTLRKTNFELERGPGSCVSPQSTLFHPEGGIANGQSRHAHVSANSHVRVQDDDEKRSKDKKGDTSDADGVPKDSAVDTDKQGLQPERQTSHSRRSSFRDVEENETATIQSTDVATVGTVMDLVQQEERERLANSRSGEFFRIVHCKTEKLVQINFSSLKKSTLPEIVLDMHKVSLDYDPPSPGLQQAGKTSKDYQPPPFPTYRAPPKIQDSRTSSKLKTLFGNSTDKQSGTYNQDQNEREFEKALTVFADYVIAYAQWYTDWHKFYALKGHDYHFEFQKQLEPYDKAVVIKHIPIGREIEYVKPDFRIHITFISRQLISQNMIRFRDIAQVWNFVEEGPYNEHLRLLGRFAGYEYQPYD